jgi:hypothetical protein
MLHIAPLWDETPRVGGKGHAMVVFRDFRGIWLILPQFIGLLSSSQFWLGNWRIILQGNAGKQMIPV